MNPLNCRIALRPRGPLEVFDLTMTFLRARARPVLRMLALTVLPAWVLLAPVAWLTGGHWATLLVVVLLSPVLQAPFTVLGGSLMFADDVRIGRVLREVVRTLPTLIVTWLIGSVGWVLSLVTCLYGMPFIQAGLLYLPEAAMLERVRPMRTLRRSTRLAGANVLIALVGAVARWFLLVWFGLLGELVGVFVLDTILQLHAPLGTILDGQITPLFLLGALISQPVFALYRLLLYVDVRTRVEGWDLQVALRALDPESAQ